jgi:hypothetical protein
LREKDQESGKDGSVEFDEKDVHAYVNLTFHEANYGAENKIIFMKEVKRK